MITFLSTPLNIFCGYSNHFMETVHLSTHSIYFDLEIRKYILITHSYQEACHINKSGHMKQCHCGILIIINTPDFSKIKVSLHS